MKLFFRDRDCVTMVRPVEAEQALQYLETKEDEDLRPEWIDAVYKTRSKIFRKCKMKSYNDQNIDGPMLAEMAEAYSHSINSGQCPNIENAWNYMVKSESLKAKKEALNNLSANLNEATISNLLDEDWIKATKKKTLVIFKSFAMGNQDEIDAVKNKLREEIHVLVNDKIKYIKRDYEDAILKWFDEKTVYLKDCLNEGTIKNLSDVNKELDLLEKEFLVYYFCNNKKIN